MVNTISSSSETMSAWSILPKEKPQVMVPLHSCKEVSSEFLYTESSPTFCHAPTMTEVASGVLLAAFYKGATPSAGPKDFAICGCRQEFGKWSEPFSIAPYKKDRPCWDPVLFTMPDGQILCFYKVSAGPQEKVGLMRRSADGGKTWGDEEALPKGISVPAKNKPLLVDSEVLACPASWETNTLPKEHSHWYCEIEMTSDAGKTWEKSAPIEYAEKKDSAYDEKEDKSRAPGIIQPTLFFDDAGLLHLLCRSKNVGYICHATSKDLGRHWSPIEKTDLENPNCGIDAVRLKNGHILLAYNPIREKRNKLALARSRDGGRTWDKEACVLEDHEEGEYSYPAIIQTSDGKIHVTYAFERKLMKHVIIEEL